jgi:pilus assembly protein CpaF
MLLLVGVLIFFKLTEKREPRRNPHEQDKKYTIAAMIEYVKTALSEMTTSNLEHLGLSEEEYNRQLNQRSQLKKALKGCTYGDLYDKNFVKNTIFDLLYKTYGLSEENINLVIPFDNKKQLTPQDKFEILLHLYKKNHGSNALSRLIETHNLAQLRTVVEDNDETEEYFISPDDIEKVFKSDSKNLSYEDKLKIVVQRIYQQYKGFSVIDEIRDMKIDGVSGGVSGVPLNQVDPDDDMNYLSSEINRKSIPLAHDSVWIFYRGKSVHLSFLSFGSEGELKRVCQNIYRYNNPGQLSESNGFKVNEMKDGSRVVVVRPGFSESWAFFVRKFDVQSATLEHWIPESEKNRDFIIQLLAFLIKGCRILAVTGAQGSGKTTLLMALIKYIDPTFPIRVQEMAFELHLRKIYKRRNILSLRETETISGQDGLDVQKKTDGTVNILGEVATDPVAAWMIQMAQVASLFTIFTHHAKTFPDLVKSLRNSLLKTRMFNDEKTAEEQVVTVLNFDIHLKRKRDGKRFIERITECIPLEQEHSESIDLKQIKDPQDKMAVFYDQATAFFNKNNRKAYQERVIVKYVDGEYVPGEQISERNATEMFESMTDTDQAAFQEFIQQHWG